MRSIEETAKYLASEHAKEDGGLEAVYWAPAEDEVHLLEVSSLVPDTGEVLPFRFVSDPPDVPYPTVIILLSPGDWRQIENGSLELPPSYKGNLNKLEVSPVIHGN
ncbi:MAG TPA: hypothetical protein VFJ58_27305 [Armatimonadota bacterium]|nr:hypothetical protein [Armatimonadota bacterium]